MTAIPVPPGASATVGARSAGRLPASVVVIVLLAVFITGIALWSVDRDQAVTAAGLPGAWLAEDLIEAADDLGVRPGWVVTFLILLELIPALAGMSAAALLLRGSTTWFRSLLAIELALYGTMGGSVPAVLDHVIGGVWGDVALLLHGVAWMALFPFAFVFPDGRFVPSWSRWALLLAVGYLPFAMVWEASGRDPDALVPIVLALVLMVFAVVAVAYRYRVVADARQRRQMRGVAAAFALRLAYSLLTVVPPLRALTYQATGSGLVAATSMAVISYVIAAMLPAAVVVAMLRHRLYGFDLWVNRTLVYAVLTVLVVVGYALLAALGGLFWTGSHTTGALVVTVVLAAAFHPLRVRVQRGVDRFVYGRRLDPQSLLAELTASRERILRAREEERGRLQRDLHDGLGPTLASLYQRMDAARALIGTDPGMAERMLTDVAERTRTVIDEIRTLVRDLRPPELDQLGLAGAISARAARFDGLRAEIDATQLGAITPSAEAAAYWIVTEALTNVARHACARTASIRLESEWGTGGGWLLVVVTDDGVGLGVGTGVDSVGGTGLRSMAERAAELGGTCLVESVPGGGTRVTARLPLDGWG